MATHRSRLVRHLDGLSDAFAAEHPEAGLAYPGGPAQFVLEHGRWFTPRGALPLEPSNCYGNAMLLASQLRWGYVEGYALMPAGRIGTTVYVGQEINQHAWSLDAGEQPVEVTWHHPGRAYLGVVFDAGRVDDAMWNGDATVLDDPQRGWPLLRERWQGETWSEPPSGRLELLTGLADGVVTGPVYAGPQAAGLLERLRGRAAELGHTEASMAAAGFDGARLGRR